MSREIVFEINGERYEAAVDGALVGRSALVDGQLTVEHPSESYAIYMVVGHAGDHYVARPIREDDYSRRDPLASDNDIVLGKCAHGVDLDREFCSEGCRV